MISNQLMRCEPGAQFTKYLTICHKIVVILGYSKI